MGLLTAVIVLPVLRAPAFATFAIGMVTFMALDVPSATTSEVLAFM